MSIENGIPVVGLPIPSPLAERGTVEDAGGAGER
jgi:hypothetical protein